MPCGSLPRGRHYLANDFGLPIQGDEFEGDEDDFIALRQLTQSSLTDMAKSVSGMTLQTCVMCHPNAPCRFWDEEWGAIPHTVGRFVRLIGGKLEVVMPNTPMDNPLKAPKKAGRPTLSKEANCTAIVEAYSKYKEEKDTKTRSKLATKITDAFNRYRKFEGVTLYPINNPTAMGTAIRLWEAAGKPKP